MTKAATALAGRLLHVCTLSLQTGHKRPKWEKAALRSAPGCIHTLAGKHPLSSQPTPPLSSHKPVYSRHTTARPRCTLLPVTPRHRSHRPLSQAPPSALSHTHTAAKHSTAPGLVLQRHPTQCTRMMLHSREACAPHTPGIRPVARGLRHPQSARVMQTLHAALSPKPTAAASARRSVPASVIAA